MAIMTIEGNELVIRVDLDTAGRLSESGKSQVLDTTHGFTAIETQFGVVKLGLNVITADKAWTGGRKPAQPAAPKLVKSARPVALPPTGTGK